MRWQRGMRVVMAVVGLSCVAAVYYYSRPGERPPAPPPVGGPMADMKATAEATTGKVNRFDFEKNKNAYTIEFVHSASYPDGHSRYEGVHLESTRGDRKFDVTADTAEERGKSVTGDNPGVVDLSGHVRLKTSDGLALDTDAASYEDALGVAKIPGHLTFSRGRLSGESVGATYNREKDVLELLTEPHVIMAPDESGGGAVDATAELMEIARADRYVRLQGRSRIVRDREELSSDKSILHLTEDESGVELIEMIGRASVVPRGTGPGATPEMRATDINLAFRPDGKTLQRASLNGRATLVTTDEGRRRTITGGRIDVQTGPDGRTLSGLEARDQVVVTLPATSDAPARTINSATLIAQGDDQGLKSALFEGGVRFVESQPATAGSPAVSRTGTSKSLSLVLLGELDAIDEADFHDDVKFTDQDVTASAGLARYFATKNQLLLSPPRGAESPVPTVTEGNEQDGTVRIDGLAMTLNTLTHDLDATGGVSTRTLPAKTKNASTKSPALFEEGKEVDGTAATVHYVSDTKRATYTGTTSAPAVVWQDQNVIKAAEVEFEQDSGNLTASGNVDSTFLLDSSPKGSTTGKTADKPSKNTALAATMVYRDADRRAVYTGAIGKLARLQSSDGSVVTGLEITLELAKEERSLRRMIAKTGVFATFEGGREAGGDGLTYDATTDAYVLTGKPAKVKVRQSDPNTTSCTLHQGRLLNFARDGGVTGEGGGALVTQVKIGCAESIR